ncbi:S-layer family protein [Nodularia sp. UHCC 0506]|uniref:S-layer family protein n=1 Tax=Nodularia sp. UHCC 0506 TaxID=3110243 RepID=UPI002B200235|nr:S-layer family protein [Nodularia sp. UHCC 0506]MEA5513409.1 S-layer family protein [Nodularia sp. UHCC 0506]
MELPENLTDPSQQISTKCADRSNSSFVATGRGGIPQNPIQEVRSNRTWSDVRDISAFHQNTSVIAQTPKSPDFLVSATTWHRHTDGTIELITAKSPTHLQQPLACIDVSNSSSN